MHIEVNGSIVIAMENSTPLARRPGRPLSFDRDAALNQAMLLFWQHGFEGTSIAQLTVAMGVTPPSIYAAFGDKKHLFREAVARYLSGPITSEQIIAKAATARDAAWGLLRSAAVGFTGMGTPAGCLLANAAVSCSASAADIQEELATVRRGIELKLCQKFTQAIKVGELLAETDAEAMAGQVMAVIQGMSTMARDGATQEKLLRVAEITLRNWPARDRQRSKGKGRTAWQAGS